MAKVSFIIPVYNCEQYLKSCIDRIKAIQLESYEVILVDDGASDNSGSICDELERTNEEVRCIHQKNQGVSAARNRGLKEAAGDNIIFVDADDSFDCVGMTNIFKIVEENPKIDLVIYGMSFDYYHRGKCYRQDEMFYPKDGIMGREQWLGAFAELYEANALSPIWNKIFRKDILEENHLVFNPKMFLYEDLEFSIRYMACCNEIYNVSECVYHYRQSEDEGNAGRRLKKIGHLPELVNQIEEALDVLMDAQCAQKQEVQIKNILWNLYLVLAREKISVSNIKETRVICDDFAAWAKDRTIEIPEQNRRYVEWILNKKVYHLLAKRNYIAVRHKIAIWLKNTSWYQKRKGMV